MPSRQPERNAWNTGTVKKENKQPSSDGDLEVVHREVLMETTGLPERGPGGEPERRGKGTSLGSTHAACGQVRATVSLGQPSAPVPHLHLRSTSKLWGPECLPFSRPHHQDSSTAPRLHCLQGGSLRKYQGSGKGATSVTKDHRKNVNQVSSSWGK